jgi:hypothetical protein
MPENASWNWFEGTKLGFGTANRRFPLLGAVRRWRGHHRRSPAWHTHLDKCRALWLDWPNLAARGRHEGIYLFSPDGRRAGEFFCPKQLRQIRTVSARVFFIGLAFALASCANYVSSLEIRNESNADIVNVILLDDGEVREIGTVRRSQILHLDMYRSSFSSEDGYFLFYEWNGRTYRAKLCYQSFDTPVVGLVIIQNDRITKRCGSARSRS